MSVSVWHPLFGPIEDYPLAVCDSRTVSESDLVESDFIYPNFESETFCVSFSPSHKWFYMKDQGRNDILVLSNFDSETGLRKYRPRHDEASARTHTVTMCRRAPQRFRAAWRWKCDTCEGEFRDESDCDIMNHCSI